MIVCCHAWPGLVANLLGKWLGRFFVFLTNVSIGSGRYFCVSIPTYIYVDILCVGGKGDKTTHQVLSRFFGFVLSVGNRTNSPNEVVGLLSSGKNDKNRPKTRLSGFGS